MNYTKHDTSYSVTVDGKYLETNDFDKVMDFLHQCNMEREIAKMPEDQYQALLKKDDSEHHDYSGIEHRELTNTVEL